MVEFEGSEIRSRVVFGRGDMDGRRAVVVAVAVVVVVVVVGVCGWIMALVSGMGC